MAAVFSPEAVGAGSAAPLALPNHAGVSASPELEIICKAMGMNPQPASELEIPDWDFLQELAKLPTDFTAIPKGTDVQGMRRWIDNVYLKGPFAEHRARFSINRRQPVAKVEIRDVSVPCLDGSPHTFVIRVYDPQHDDPMSKKKQRQLRPAILMIHGGGWIHGNPQCDEAMSVILASELGAVVLGVDYRLAPEHQFPAPLNDCSQALAWIHRHSDEYKVDPFSIALWGASAGGNLAAAVALRHTQEQTSTGMPKLRLVSLVVPVTAHPRAQAVFQEQRVAEKSKLEETVASLATVPAEVVSGFEKLYELYIGQSADIHDPLVSPLMTRSIAHHPKTHITVAACDYLMPQGLAYAQVLRSFGTEVTEEILPGVPHGFTMPMNATVTKRWLENQRDIFMDVFESPEL